MNNKKYQAPCAYQGGKSRIASDIVDIIFKENVITDSTKFYDLCCGSGAISIELVNRGIDPRNIVMVDQSPWGLFWQKVGLGEFSTDVFRLYIDDIPNDISKIKKYAQDMLSRPANDELFQNAVYKFLILQSCAFGSSATWIEDNVWKKAGGLRDYWIPTETSNRRSPVNPMMPMPNTLFDRVEALVDAFEGVVAFQTDATSIQIDTGSIVYIDPPYNKTAKYGYEMDYLAYISKIKGSKVYLSEGKKLSNNAHLITSTRKKGGINGKRKSANEEWLNVFPGDL